MSSEWPLLTLEEAGVRLIDCDHKTPKAREEGYPYVGIPQLKDGRIVLDGARLISEEDFNQWRRKAKPIDDDVILSRRCNPGESAYVPSGLEIALGQNLVLLRSDGVWVYPPFLRWVTQGPHWWSQVGKYLNVGAVFDSLKCADITKFEVFLPPIREQKKIADILGGIDHKVLLNQQINQTLEQMAQAIFKSWFVDFEPVKAKIAARERWQAHQSAQQPASPVCYAAELEPESVDPELETRMALAAMQAISGKTEAQLARLQTEHPEHYAELRATADLFPAAMQESELGEIPEGWRVAPFSDLARLDTTSVKPAQQPEKEWEHYSIPAFDDGQTPAHEFGADIKSNKYKVHRSAVLASKLNPHFPRTWIPLVEDETAAICSTEFMPFVPLEESHRPFVAGMVTSAPFQSGIMMRVTGSTGSRQRAQPKQVAVMDVVTPPTALIAAYSKLADPLMASTARNISQSQTLAKLRDTLLPKLLSGEITVPEVDSQLDEATETAHV